MTTFFGIEDTVSLDFRDVIVIDFEDTVEEVSVPEAEQDNIIDIDLYPFAAVGVQASAPSRMIWSPRLSARNGSMLAPLTLMVTSCPSFSIVVTASK